MSQVLNRENITISIGEYQKDGQTKQEYRTIGEIITMQGDDGSTYQFGRLWGPGGAVKFNIYAKEDRNQQAQQQGVQQPMQGNPAQQTAVQQPQQRAPQQQQQAQQMGSGAYDPNQPNF